MWYLDSGCSRHMTRDSTLLTKFVERAGPSITFGDDNKGYTMGYSLISSENVLIESVALVDGLKHKLLSISQLCDRGNEVWFTKDVTSRDLNEQKLFTGSIYASVFSVVSI